MKKDVVYPELSYKLVGVLFAVHNALGRYCNEKQYADLIEKYLKDFSIAHEREKSLPASFIGEKDGRNRIDFLIDNRIVLEVKAKRVLSRGDYFQTMRYLQAMKKRLGILVNFQQKFLFPKRVLNGYDEVV